MSKNPEDKNGTDSLVEAIVQTYRDDSGINFIDISNLPLRDKILEVLDQLREVLFPGYTGKRKITKAAVGFIVGDILCQVRSELNEQIERALRYRCRMDKCDGCDCRAMAENITNDLLDKLPSIRQLLKSDIQAAYDGDPAAQSFEEIVISYPFITAIATHRIAHELYDREVPLIPRIMNEYAHQKTGIDIHPGAKIGRHFFIDHGTGVVIGETAVIGNNVRIYHGVTLGALRFQTDKNGRLIKGGKRHPTVEDNVIICPEATILGDITIGNGALIGSNTWVQEDVPPGVTVKMASPELTYKKRKGKARAQI
ncbi:MAG: serine O-acetyltransferase EpsC [Planctomycetota bacterium]